MPRIEESEEFSRDWDWYAVDEDGKIGHFTTAGLRPLPETVRDDRDAAEKLILHFEEARAFTTYMVREAAERDAGGWGSRGRDGFMNSFAEMSKRGLFSHNTQMAHGPEAAYYLVTTPREPLTVADVPDEIRALLLRTRAPLKFGHTDYISESETIRW
jgi:hypothetical protein